MHRVSVDLIRGFAAMFAQVTRVTLDRLALIVADAFRVGLYKAAIEDAARQTLVVVCFDCLEIMDRDAGLIADFA
jgi:hypothetical protein